MRCILSHDGRDVPATGYVRRAGELGRDEHISGPLCDAHQAQACVRWRALGHREVGAVPLDYRERLTEARREGIKRRISDELIDHPGGPSAIADDLFHVMLHLGADYTVPALLDLVGARIAQWQAEHDDQAAERAAEIDPEEAF